MVLNLAPLSVAPFFVVVVCKLVGVFLKVRKQRGKSAKPPMIIAQNPGPCGAQSTYI
jgi:hypothetical protein